MTMRLGIALLALAALVIAILLMREPSAPPAREIDIVSSLINGFVVPMGDSKVVSRASDCRTDGTTKVPVPASLFERFLAANPEDRQPFDLKPFAARVRVDTSGESPRRLFARGGEPVVAISRAGYTEHDALVCVEVFAAEERAFFVLLKRDATGWHVSSEEEAWRAPEPEPFEAEDDEV